jgi:hypothetical protein
LTSGFFPDQFSRAKRGKVWIYRVAAQGAAGQAQVRAKDFFGSNLLRKRLLSLIEKIAQALGVKSDELLK